MYLHAHLAGVEYGSKVGGDDGIYALGLSPVYYAAHNIHLRVVDDDIHREVGLNARSMCRANNLSEVVEREVHTRCRTHVELLDTEIYRVGTRRDGSIERLVRPHRGHNLYILSSDHISTSFFP